MPAQFLTDEQRRRYGRFIGEPSPDQLSQHFHLDDADRDFISLHRGDHNRLGCAVLLCTARFLGTFLVEPVETPSGVISFLARQLHIEEIECIGAYCLSRQRWDHMVEIRARYGFQDFSHPAAQFRLNRWLYASC